MKLCVFCELLNETNDSECLLVFSWYKTNDLARLVAQAWVPEIRLLSMLLAISSALWSRLRWCLWCCRRTSWQARMNILWELKSRYCILKHLCSVIPYPHVCTLLSVAKSNTWMSSAWLSFFYLDVLISDQMSISRIIVSFLQPCQSRRYHKWDVIILDRNWYWIYSEKLCTHLRLLRSVGFMRHIKVAHSKPVIWLSPNLWSTTKRVCNKIEISDFYNQ